VSVCTSAIIIQKGIAHKKEANILWANLKDGLRKKGGMVNSTLNSNILEIKHVILALK